MQTQDIHENEEYYHIKLRRRVTVTRILTVTSNYVYYTDEAGQSAVTHVSNLRKLDWDADKILKREA